MEEVGVSSRWPKLGAKLFLLTVSILTLVYIFMVWELESATTTMTAASILKQRDFNHININKTVELVIPSVVLECGNDGMGNQLFRYAAAYSLARRLNLTLFIIPQATHRNYRPNSRAFVLDNFNLSPDVCYLPPKQTIPRDKKFTWNTSIEYNKTPLPTDKVLFSAAGAFESEIFFEEYKEDLIEQFQMVNINQDKIRSTMEKIENSESVAVHIRRGDFVFDSIERLLPLSYQIRAMELISNLKKDVQLKFFIFSDSIESVKAELSALPFIKDEVGLENVIYVSNPSMTSLEEFYLMQHCKHIITPNSTFSWWAAYLNRNKNKIVIVPFPRQRRSFYKNVYGPGSEGKINSMIEWKYSYPKGWIGINPFESFEDSLGSDTVKLKGLLATATSHKLSKSLV